MVRTQQAISPTEPRTGVREANLALPPLSQGLLPSQSCSLSQLPLQTTFPSSPYGQMLRADYGVSAASTFQPQFAFRFRCSPTQLGSRDRSRSNQLWGGEGGCWPPNTATNNSSHPHKCKLLLSSRHGLSHQNTESGRAWQFALTKRMAQKCCFGTSEHKLQEDQWFLLPLPRKPAAASCCKELQAR